MLCVGSTARATGSLLLGLAVVLAADGARGELLTFEGRLLAVLPTLGETEVASGVGVAAIEGLQLESIDVLDARIAGSAGIPVTDPTAAPVTSIRVAASVRDGHLGIGPSGSFGTPVLTSNTLAMPGELQVCMLLAPLPPCVGGFAMPLTRSSGALGVGVGGVITFGASATLMVSLYGAPFTVNTALATGATSGGSPFTLFSAGSIGGPALFTSSAGQPGGFVSLVTPIRVVGGQGDGPSNLVPGFLRFEIRFLPEPGVALLATSGSIGLLLAARSRASRATGPRNPSPRDE